MVAVASELMTTFNAATAYTCSDEITLLFPYFPREDGKKSNLMYDGKVQKIGIIEISPNILC